MKENTGSFRRDAADGQAGVRARNTRLVMAGAFLGALVVLALSTVFSWRVGDWEVGGGAVSNETTLIEKAFTAPQGACLTWQAPDAGDIAQVPCTDEHEFEVIGSVPVRPGPGEDPPLPSAERWRELTQQRCAPEAQRYLGGELDPFGKFTVGALTPTQGQWEDGERTMRCGLQHAGVTGEPLAVTGSARDDDQSDVHEPGTCLGITADNGVGDPVECDKRHAYEIVGNVDLAEEFDEEYPSESAQSEKLPALCNRELETYAGTRKLPDDLVIGWDTLKPASWAAGSRRVDCKVAGELSKGAKELQPVTGSVAESARQSSGAQRPGRGDSAPESGAGSSESEAPEGGDSEAPAP